MKTSTIIRMLAGVLLLAILQAGCAPVAQTSPAPSTTIPTENPVPPTATITAPPQPTATQTPFPIPAAAPLVDKFQLAVLQMADEQYGWGVLKIAPDSRLAAIGRTADGGQTWYNVTPAGAEAFTEDDTFLFLDSHAAWLLLPNEGATSTLYGTTDGGATWTVSSAVPFYVGPMGELSFMDNSYGWALVHSFTGNVDSVAIFKTIDGGQTWQQTYSNDPANPVGGAEPTPPENPLHITFVDTQTGWLSASGEGLVGLYITQDGGANWTRQDLELPQLQASHPGIRLISFDQPRQESAFIQAGKPVFFSRQDGVMPVLMSTDERPYIVFYITHDGGQTWTPTQPIAYLPGIKISIASMNDFFVWDGNFFQASHDGGQTWNELRPNIGFGAEYARGGDTLTELQFINATTGFATGTRDTFDESGQPVSYPVSFKTTDGGQTWTQVIGGETKW